MATQNIRLSLNKELEKVLKEIQSSFPLLEYTEIIRMALSSYYQEFRKHKNQNKCLPTHKATKEEETSITKGLKDIKNKNFTTIKQVDEKKLKAFLESDK